MTTSPTIIDLSAKLAGYNLYASRGIGDPEDTQMNQLKMHKEYAEKTLDDLVSARITVDAEQAVETTFPTVEVINE